MANNKIASGFAWSSIESFSLQGIRFIIGIFLARILSPSDYGMIGMLTVFMVISDLLINSGFGSALIQKKDRTKIDYATVFYFNLLVSGLVYGALFLASPYIADFYNLPELEALTKFIAVPLIINALCIVQNTKYMIELNFKTPAIIAIVSSILQGVSGILMAYNGFGIWSLVYSNIIGVSVKCILLWITSDWLPMLAFSKRSFHQLFGFGSKLVGVALIEAVYTNIYPLVIGKFYNASSLGFFSRAQGYSNLPSGIMTSLIYKVAFPAFCNSKNNEELFSNYTKMIGIVAFLIFPMMVFLAVMAEPLIVFFITEKWINAVLLLQILCFSGMWYPIYEVNISLIKALGKSNLLLKLQIINKIFAVLVLIVTIPLGIVAMSIGLVIVTIFTFFLNLFYTSNFLGHGILAQLKGILPSFAIALFSGVLIYVVNHFIVGGFYQLVVGSIIGLVSYVSLSLLFKIDSLQNLILLKQKKNEGNK